MKNQKMYRVEGDDYTALDLVSLLYKHATQCELSQEYLDMMAKYISPLSELWKLNDLQTLLFAIFFVQLEERNSINEVFYYVNLKGVSKYKYKEEIEILFKKGLVEAQRNGRMGRRDYFNIPDKIIEKVIYGLPFEESELEEMTFFKALNDIRGLIKDSEFEDSNTIQITRDLSGIYDLAKDIPLFTMMEAEGLTSIDKFILLSTVHVAVRRSNNDYATNLERLTQELKLRDREKYFFIEGMLDGTNELIQKDLIEVRKGEFRQDARLKLTSRVIQFLKEKEKIQLDNKVANNNFLNYATIKERSLFYNKKEQEQLDVVYNLIQPDQFKLVQQRLKEKNRATGVTVLFYGAPGTGKTESIYQFARQTNRNIFKVDISETKSMWFGESQKLVKKIFTDYKNLMNTQKNCPILLLNEADGIIGKRKVAGSSNTADTENAIQNILLEELENFEGILFATTNLQDNLDDAFERRFLFKIKFETPSEENSARIWRDKLPFLTKKQANELAVSYSFSGGEIENITRKVEIQEVLFGKKITFEQVLNFCNEERWNDNRVGKMIGFKAS